MTRSGGRILVDQRVLHGADHAFCVPGESYLAVLDALHDAPIRLVTSGGHRGARSNGDRMRLLAAAVLAALALAGCGTEDAEEAAAPQPVTVTETETVTETLPPPATTEPPEVACSTAGLRLILPEQELPEAVAEVRQRVFDAAVACDYETLEQIALEQGEGFTFSYGGSDSAAAFWRDVEEAGVERPLPMRALATILTIPHSRNETGSYAWPSAYEETPTDEDWQAVVDAGLYTQAEVEQMKGPESTGYLGYRTAITPDGDWQFFVAGD
ncbi:MAG: hypothetical protein M3R12_04265 [Actinomycetota bacterium]|nr:hypothetical protein [Actinomycetota bacterium]